MATYTYIVPDEQEPCITAARTAYNNSIPAEVPDPGNPDATIPNPDLKPDNAAYMAWVMQNAVASYCTQYFPRFPDGVPTPPA